MLRQFGLAVTLGLALIAPAMASDCRDTPPDQLISMATVRGKGVKAIEVLDVRSHVSEVGRYCNFVLSTTWEKGMLTIYENGEAAFVFIAPVSGKLACRGNLEDGTKPVCHWEGEDMVAVSRSAAAPDGKLTLGSVMHTEAFLYGMNRAAQR